MIDFLRLIGIVNSLTSKSSFVFLLVQLSSCIFIFCYEYKKEVSSKLVRLVYQYCLSYFSNMIHHS